MPSSTDQATATNSTAPRRTYLAGALRDVVVAFTAGLTIGALVLEESKLVAVLMGAAAALMPVILWSYRYEKARDATLTEAQRASEFVDRQQW